MVTGLAAGVLWALDTVILGAALSMAPFISGEQALFLAPFVSTFLHDFSSSVYMLIYSGIRKQFGALIKALKSKSGKFILLGAVLGGPVGMSGYVAAIKYIGPAYTAVISAMYPALGAFLSFVFLKEKMRPSQIIGLCACVAGVVALGYEPGADRPENFILGFFCALLCCIGWASEGVICTYGMRDPDVSSSHALALRQITSSVFYTLILLPALGGWGFTLSAFPTKAFSLIAAAAFFGTASYLCYYRALGKIGVSKAMPLNITYSAWAILFSFLILGSVPDAKSIICGAVTVAGSLAAASDKKAHKA